MKIGFFLDASGICRNEPRIALKSNHVKKTNGFYDLDTIELAFYVKGTEHFSRARM